MTRHDKQHPGVETVGIITQFAALFDGGTIAPEQPQMDGMLPFDRAALSVVGGSSRITLAVRTGGGGPAIPLGRLNEWVGQENTFEDSKRYALALTRERHLETYVHSGAWVRPGRVRRRVPVYRFHSARALTAAAGSRRWRLTAGGRIDLPAGTQLPAED